MKKALILSTILFTSSATAGIYTNSGNFRPYVGINAGLNIADYTYETDLDDTYYSATINAGARIGRNFGVELFFAHSTENELETITDFFTSTNNVYFMAYGFDIYGYYNISNEFDFFTTFGVSNYKVYNEHKYTDNFSASSEKTSDNDVGTRIGIGLMYTFPGDQASVLFRYNYIPLNTELINTISEFSVGFRYNF